MNSVNVMDNQSPQRPSRLWLWLTIPPLAAVVGAVITITLALTNPDPVIHADMQKVGKTVVRNNSAALAAQQLGLHALLWRDGTDGAVTLRLFGDTKPSDVQLLWIHPTRADGDRGAVLLPSRTDADAGYIEYTGVLPQPPDAQNSAHGTWVLQDGAQRWALETPAQTLAGEFELQPVVR